MNRLSSLKEWLFWRACLAAFFFMEAGANWGWWSVLFIVAGWIQMAIIVTDARIGYTLRKELGITSVEITKVDDNASK